MWPTSRDAMFLRPEGSILGWTNGCEGFKSPKARHTPSFTLPGRIALQGGGGEIHVRYIVSPTGSVENLVVLWASDKSMVEPCLRTLREWRYRPGRCGGEDAPVARNDVFYVRRP